MRRRLILAAILIALVPLLQSCTAATYGGVSLANRDGEITVILRQCAGDSDRITLDERDDDGNFVRTVAEWKALKPVEATRTIRFALSDDPDPKKWKTVTSFEGQALDPDRSYGLWADGTDPNGNAPGSVPAFTSTDVAGLEPGEVLDSIYSYDKANERDIFTTVSTPLREWAENVDEMCAGNGW